MKCSGLAKYVLGSLFLFLWTRTAYSQNQKSIDSLEATISSHKNDAVALKAKAKLIELYIFIGEIDKSIKLNRAYAKEVHQAKDQDGLCNAYHNFANYFLKTDQVDSANYYNDSLGAISRKINNKPKIIQSINNSGSIYFYRNDYKKALMYYDSALRVEARYGFKEGEYASLNNIGLIYLESHIPKMAIKYFLKSAKYASENHKLKPLVYAYGGISDAYTMLSKYDSALYYARLELKSAIVSQSNMKIAESHCDIGISFKLMKVDDSALVYLNKSLLINKELDDIDLYFDIYSSLAEIYYRQNKIEEASAFVAKMEQLKQENGFYPNANHLYELYAALEGKKGNYKKANEYLMLYIAERDTFYNTEVTSQLSEMSAKYETEKKEKENQLLQAQNLLSEETIKQQKTISYFIIGGLLVVCVFTYYIFRGLSRQRKANQIIYEQKVIVEEKHKEITDSINYAERIQRSFLASKALLDQNLNSYFVFFQPKDIVSGDFYWAGKLSNGNFALVTADSTGHGVPGAIMSILNISSLEKAVERGLYNPAEILNDTRQTIIDRLKKDGSAEGGKDGMDCSLVSFDFKNNKLVYAAANNPVWIVRGEGLIELLPDKMPVGKHDKDQVSFVQHEVDLQKGDMVYALTDGMADQFGGPNGKKFKYKQLKELLITIAPLPLSTQHQQLKNALNTWKGNLEQIDDICIIGIKL